MILILKMAYRDLMRNKRRSLFSSLAIALGLAVLLLIASFIAGEMRDALDLSINLVSGHLQVRAKSYDEGKTSLAWQDLIENPAAIAAQVASLEPVKVATPRLFATGIVAAMDESIGVRIIGIDPASAANKIFQDGMSSGQWLKADDREGILIGQPLADKLGLKVGDSLSLDANTSNGDVSEQTFTIRGIYNTHTPTYDETTVFMPLAKAQAITQTEDHASVIYILLKDKDQAGAVINALKSSQYQVLDWAQMNEMLVQFEQLAAPLMGMIYLIVLAITATVIVNTMIMAVFERTREIGILSALGMNGGRIMAVFFAESGYLAIGGILFGLIIGGLIIAYTSTYGFYLGNLGLTGLQFHDTIYTYLTLQDTISLTIITFVITLLSALYPALLASRMEPVEALRSAQ